MEGLLLVLQKHPGPSVFLFSLIFRGVHRLLQRLPQPKVVVQDEFRSWEWRNLSVSMVHSLLTGPWALACAVTWPPEMLNELHSYHTPSSYLLVCVSTGYFVQDSADIILAGHGRGSWEFLVHHALVIPTFLYALYTRLYISTVVVALFVEVNSVTLHLRLLLKRAGATSSTVYHINKVINMCTFIIFRLCSQLYLTWYILRRYSWLPHASFFLAALMAMNVMILVYLYRLVRSDFILHRAGKSRAQDKNSKRFVAD
ncbi:TLC domain-containing protein 1 [Dunckerocampus dactyliophorus]|uniref:TLC domain-containing protein 1 n=1 Tax=Dunckerocampus dactyliophorus TaxID=161453 RepID=UPI00240550B8|nr:TLC domain-containing protein 1 [Dunckerocampus dactyliophorus]